MCLVLGTAVLLLGSAAGCGSATSSASSTRQAVAARRAGARPSPPASRSRAESPGLVSPATTQHFLDWMHECTPVAVSSVASAYDAAFGRGEVSSVFGTRESPVTTRYIPASPEALDTCDYSAKLAGYGSYSVYSVEWTTDPSLVEKFLGHRSSEPGDSGFALVKPPPPFTTAYEDNSGLFLASSDIAVTLGGALGSGVNGVLNVAAEERVSVCLTGASC
jgi:hypothetical protein